MPLEQWILDRIEQMKKERIFVVKDISYPYPTNDNFYIINYDNGLSDDFSYDFFETDSYNRSLIVDDNEIFINPLFKNLKLMDADCIRVIPLCKKNSFMISLSSKY